MQAFPLSRRWRQLVGAQAHCRGIWLNQLWPASARPITVAYARVGWMFTLIAQPTISFGCACVVLKDQKELIRFPKTQDPKGLAGRLGDRHYRIAMVRYRFRVLRGT
jgi:hypothetical protein